MQQAATTAKMVNGVMRIFSNRNPERMFAGFGGVGELTNRVCPSCKNGRVYNFESDGAFICRSCGHEFKQ